MIPITKRFDQPGYRVYQILEDLILKACRGQLAAIFEEHRICRQLGALGQHQFHEVGDQSRP